jgi:hypothetical protein
VWEEETAKPFYPRGVGILSRLLPDLGSVVFTTIELVIPHPNLPLRRPAQLFSWGPARKPPCLAALDRAIIFQMTFAFCVKGMRSDKKNKSSAARPGGLGAGPHEKTIITLKYKKQICDSTG